MLPFKLFASVVKATTVWGSGTKRGHVGPILFCETDQRMSLVLCGWKRWLQVARLGLQGADSVPLSTGRLLTGSRQCATFHWSLAYREQTVCHFPLVACLQGADSVPLSTGRLLTGSRQCATFHWSLAYREQTVCHFPLVACLQGADSVPLSTGRLLTGSRQCATFHWSLAYREQTVCHFPLVACLQGADSVPLSTGRLLLLQLICLSE